VIDFMQVTSVWPVVEVEHVRREGNEFVAQFRLPEGAEMTENFEVKSTASHVREVRVRLDARGMHQVTYGVPHPRTGKLLPMYWEITTDEKLVPVADEATMAKLEAGGYTLIGGKLGRVNGKLQSCNRMVRKQDPVYFPKDKIAVLDGDASSTVTRQLISAVAGVVMRAAEIDPPEVYGAMQCSRCMNYYRPVRDGSPDAENGKTVELHSLSFQDLRVEDVAVQNEELCLREGRWLDEEFQAAMASTNRKMKQGVQTALRQKYAEVACDRFTNSGMVSSPKYCHTIPTWGSREDAEGIRVIIPGFRVWMSPKMVAEFRALLSTTGIPVPENLGERQLGWRLDLETDERKINNSFHMMEAAASLLDWVPGRVPGKLGIFQLTNWEKSDEKRYASFVWQQPKAGEALRGKNMLFDADQCEESWSLLLSVTKAGDKVVISMFNRMLDRDHQLYEKYLVQRIGNEIQMARIPDTEGDAHAEWVCCYHAFIQDDTVVQ
jgi:hypothetical protein